MKIYTFWAIIACITFAGTSAASAQATVQTTPFSGVPADVLPAFDQSETSNGNSSVDFPGVPKSILQQGSAFAPMSGESSENTQGAPLSALPNTSITAPFVNVLPSSTTAALPSAQTDNALSVPVPTNCHLVDSKGAVLSNLVPGDTADSVTASGGFSGAPVSIHCDTASATDAPTVPASLSLDALSVNATVVPIVPANAQNAVVAVLSLDSSHAPGPLTLNAVPFALTENGVSADFSAITGCSMTDATNGTQISGFIQKTGPGNADFVLHQPLSLQAGHMSTLVMRCSFSASMNIGTKFCFAFPAHTFAAMAATGAIVTPAQGATITGAPGTNMGTTTVVTPVTATGSLPYYAAVPAPGVPSTGAGGGAETTYALLVGSSILALIASVYALNQLRALRREEE